MTRIFGFAAVLIISLVPTFLFSQIADNNSLSQANPQSESENGVSLTSEVESNGGAALDTNREASQHLSAPSTRSSVGDDVIPLEFSSSPSDLRAHGDPGFTVSVSSLAAPEKARKAFHKAQQEERKGKLQAALDYFKEAIGTYPGSRWDDCKPGKAVLPMPKNPSGRQ